MNCQVESAVAVEGGQENELHFLTGVAAILPDAVHVWPVVHPLASGHVPAVATGHGGRRVAVHVLGGTLT